MDLRPWYRRYWAWLLAGLALAVLVVLFGGPTVVVLNRTGKPICDVYVAHSASVSDQGSNRIRVPIEYPHSRDVRLPLFFDWFRPDGVQSRYVWAYDCDQTLLGELDWPIEKGTIIFQVER